MAISSDTSATTFSTGTSLTLSYTVGAGSNKLLIVGCLHNGGDHITGVTFNGVSMTQALKSNLRSTIEGYIYYLFAPASTTANIVVSTDGTSGEIDIHAASYFGVTQSGFPNASQIQNNISAASLTMSVTTVADNCWAYLFASPNNGPTTASTNATKLQDNLPTGDSASFDSSGHGAITPAGSFSMTYTTSSATVVDGIMVAFSPFVASATNSGFFSLMP